MASWMAAEGGVEDLGEASARDDHCMGHPNIVQPKLLFSLTHPFFLIFFSLAQGH